MPKCKSGNHFWLNQEDADKCCNGFVRILDSIRSEIVYTYKWEKIPIN